MKVNLEVIPDGFKLINSMDGAIWINGNSVLAGHETLHLFDDLCREIFVISDEAPPQKWRKVNCLEDIGKEARFRDEEDEEWFEGKLTSIRHGSCPYESDDTCGFFFLCEVKDNE